MFNTSIKSIYDLLKTFPTEQACVNYLEHILWSNTPVSPYNPQAKVYKCANNWYKDAENGRRFNIKTGTFLENTKVPLQKWFICVWLLTSNKKGVSSINLAAQLGVTQKTAWFMAHRVRAAFNLSEEKEPFEGICEADETFVGGKNRNRHKDKKVAQSQGRSFKDKKIVLGVLQRGKTEVINGRKVQVELSKVKLQVAPNTKGESIRPFILKNVEKDAVLISDEWIGYSGLGRHYDHHVVDHGKKQYVNMDNREIHSNSMESFWGILKRSFNGIYNFWSAKHIQKYCDEHAFRFNSRAMKNGERFEYFLRHSKKRTKYKDLIAA